MWGLSPELLSWGAWLLEYPWTNTAVAKTILFEFVLCFYGDYLLERVTHIHMWLHWLHFADLHSSIHLSGFVATPQPLSKVS